MTLNRTNLRPAVNGRCRQYPIRVFVPNSWTVHRTPIHESRETNESHLPPTHPPPTGQISAPPLIACLGSTSVTADADGNLRSRTLYSAWGEVRHQAGALPTDYTYTGQYSNTADFGLMYYRARWYDPSLGRFSQADTIVPGMFNPMAYDRYAYVFNSPPNYVDPSGHGACNTKNRDPECNAIADEQGRVIISGVYGREIAEWEILLLTIAVMAESMKGDYPDHAIATIAWVYLNRLGYNVHTSLYKAVKGVQSAFDAYANKDTGLFPMLGGETAEEYVARFFSSYADMSNGSWAKVFRIVRNVYRDWIKYGTDSTADPTNGATDFRSKVLLSTIPSQRGVDWCNLDNECRGLPAKQQQVKIQEYILSLSYEGAMSYHSWKTTTTTGWRWSNIGPMTVQGVTFWLFFDNRSYLAKK